MHPSPCSAARPDEELVRAAIGGPGLIAQMRELDPDRVDELVEVYRAHNEPLHATLEAFDGMLELLLELRRRGHRLGHRDGEAASPPCELAFDRLPLLRELTDVLVGAEDTERHKPDPDPVLEALRRIDADPGEAVYVGDSPFDIRPARRRGRSRSRSAGEGSIPTSDSSPRSRTHSSTTPEEILALV